MHLEAVWKAVHLTQVLYLWLKNYGQESRLKILNQDFFVAKHVTLMDLKFKTLTFKIRGLSETNRVENHKSIPIYNST